MKGFLLYKYIPPPPCTPPFGKSTNEVESCPLQCVVENSPLLQDNRGSKALESQVRPLWKECSEPAWLGFASVASDRVDYPYEDEGSCGQVIPSTPPPPSPGIMLQLWSCTALVLMRHPYELVQFSDPPLSWVSELSLPSQGSGGHRSWCKERAEGEVGSLLVMLSL